jgi:ornithine cyclodeaminase
MEKVLELGSVITGKVTGRTSDMQTTIADLTGVATQDIAIATAVHDRLSNCSTTLHS